MAEEFEVDTGAMDDDAFGFEALGLFDAVGAAKENFAAFAEDAVPGKRGARAAEGPGDLTGAGGEAGGAGYVAVGGDAAARDFADGGAEGCEHGAGCLIGWCHRHRQFLLPG
jgi:hypothetical protein